MGDPQKYFSIAGSVENQLNRTTHLNTNPDYSRLLGTTALALGCCRMKPYPFLLLLPKCQKEKTGPLQHPAQIRKAWLLHMPSDKVKPRPSMAPVPMLLADLSFHCFSFVWFGGQVRGYLGWPWTHHITDMFLSSWSSYFCLPSAESVGICHHTWPTFHGLADFVSHHLVTSNILIEMAKKYFESYLLHMRYFSKHLHNLRVVSLNP